MQHMYDIPGEMPPCCVAVGRFDGVHRGHLALVRQMVEEARERDLSPVVVSLYDPDGSCLTTEREKALLEMTLKKANLEDIFLELTDTSSAEEPSDGQDLSQAEREDDTP